jgi:outer membrane protein OmpA-like peptidoglycan-associated protein
LIDQVSELSDLLLNEFDSKKQDSLFQSLTKLLSDYQPDLETNNQVVLNQLADKLTARNQLAARQEIVLEQLTQASKVTYFELLKVPSTPENDLIKAEMARVLFDNIKRDQEFEMQRQLLAIEQQNTALFNQLNQTLATAFANDSSMNPLTAKILLADITALTDAIQQEKDPIKRAQLIQELKQKIASLSPTQQALVKDILTSIEANNEIVNELVAANAKNKLLYSDASKKAFIELSLNKDNLSTEELMARFKQFENQFNIPLASLFDVNGNKLEPQTLAEFLNAHIPDPILFDFDSAVLKSVYYSQLNDIADFLKNYPQFQVYVDGYTDITGSVSYNVKLSSKRAKSAKTYLKTLGVKESDFVLTYHGPKHPVASNKTKEGRKLNRRVEIRLVERK